ncbi:hypothetical protein PGT21_014540 [Puccinia graminis f. sp. tritici]|uniref:RecA family profile 2 domain-containing protein n=1 Tax=Puccinia graminis f. sp. tritici TaxID=56615 RepID=A0A5B0MUG0_PUCGR|nr:hypothetical protein PGT21_014540 [Puccinia graminis f. sp. tritici]
MISSFFLALLVTAQFIHYSAIATSPESIMYVRLLEEGKGSGELDTAKVGCTGSFLGSFRRKGSVLKTESNLQTQVPLASEYKQRSWIDSLCQDKETISIWLQNGKAGIDTHLNQYPALLDLKKQYAKDGAMLRNLLDPKPEMSQLFQKKLDKALLDISTMSGVDNQSAGHLAHYALVFAEITSTRGGSITRLDSVIRARIRKTLDKIHGKMDDRIAKVFTVLKELWKKPAPLPFREDPF